MTARGPLPDVIIVGAGLIGCASGYWLARRGLRVLLLERGDVADGASGACDGHLCCQSKSLGLHLKLAQQSLKLYAALPDELDADIGYRPCGSWMVAEGPEEWQALAAAVEQRRAAGLEVSLHDGPYVYREEPVLSRRIVGGSYCPTDGQVDPWQTTLGFFRAARRLGAEFALGVKVREVTVRGGTATGVRTTGGDIVGGSVLVAAGAWSASLLTAAGVALGSTARRGEILVTESMPPLLSSVVLHSRYVSAKFGCQGERPATLVMEQNAAGNLLIGSTRSCAGLDVHNTPDGVGALAAEVARMAPSIAGLSAVRCFAGLRPCSGDGLPLVGPVPGIDRLFIAGGHEGDGVALAPITGQIVADALCGGPREWLCELLPGRE
jgi:glycine/D-amino acid oxidase-like deaminating enzyme